MIECFNFWEVGKIGFNIYNGNKLVTKDLSLIDAKKLLSQLVGAISQYEELEKSSEEQDGIV